VLLILLLLLLVTEGFLLLPLIDDATEGLDFITEELVGFGDDDDDDVEVDLTVVVEVDFEVEVEVKVVDEVVDDLGTPCPLRPPGPGIDFLNTIEARGELLLSPSLFIMLQQKD
jgi:hypothetical protein